MADQHKVWTQLGLGTATAISLFAVGCSSGDQASVPTADKAAAIQDAGAAQSGEGEGGVAIAQAATDPVIYLSALAIAESHVIAARDAYAAGKTNAAGEMFAHPVSEVLADMQPVFEARGVADFNDLFIDASDAAYGGSDVSMIDAHTTTIIAALRHAESGAPDDGRSPGSIRAGVVADQIDRAADMYAIATQSEAYEPYLDGYGFLKAAMAAYSEHDSDILTDQPQVVTAIDQALSQLQAAYPTARRPDVMEANPAALKALSSQVQLSLN